MSRRLGAFISLGCIALAAAACSGGGTPLPGAGVPVPVEDASSTNREPVAVRIAIPAKQVARSAYGRHEQFIVASTRGVQILAYKPNSKHVAKNLLASLVVNVAAKSASCKPLEGGGRTCKATLGLPPPAVDFVVTTWDKSPANGKPTGKELAAGGSIDRKIKTGKNTIRLTLGGIPESLAVTLPSPSPVASVPTLTISGTQGSSVTIGVDAFDADGNQIIADGFADPSGNPRSIALSANATNASCGSAGFSSATIASPDPDGVAFQYGATATAQLFTASAPCKFTLEASVGSIQSPPVAIALSGPVLSTYAITGLGGAKSAPDGIVAASGNIWFADTGASAIGELNVTSSPYGAITEYSSVESGRPANAPFGITVGPNGNVWFTESAQIGEIPPLSPGSLTTHPIPTPPGYSGSTALGEQITRGPADILVWFTFPGANEIASIDEGYGSFKTYPAVTPSPPATNGVPMGIVAQNESSVKYLLWITDTASNVVQGINPDGTPVNTFHIFGAPSSPGSVPAFIVVGGSENTLWYTSPAMHSINNMVQVAGGVESYSAGASSQPWGLTAGPDGAIWFADKSGYIDRVPTGSPTTPAVTRYSIGETTVPKWVTTGPDGAIWFTESGTGAIGRIGL